MFGYIYEITNKINGKKYIGQKKSDKFLYNKYLGRGTIIKQAHDKYGRNNFEAKLLRECNSKEELDYYETYYINKFDAVNSPEYYNITKGGDDGNTISGLSNENLINFKSKLSNIHKGRIIVNKDGKEYHIKEEELEEYLSRGFVKGRGDFIKSDAFRQAQRNRNIGRKRSDLTKAKMSEAFKGRIYSEETKKNMSEAAKRRPHTYWMHKGEEVIKIREELIERYLAEGFERGRGKYRNQKLYV